MIGAQVRTQCVESAARCIAARSCVRNRMRMSLRRIAATAVLAAGIVAATALPASAASGWGEDINPGGGTVGLQCVYVNGANPPELCDPYAAPLRDITPPKHLRNPFTAIWHDITSLF